MSKDVLLWGFVRVTLFKERLRARFIKGVTALVATSPVLAFADGDIADMGNRVAEGAKSGMKSALIIAQFVGLLFVAGGLVAAKTKKDNPQVKTTHIIAAIAFGVCLIVIPEIIRRSQTQMGLTPVNIG